MAFRQESAISAGPNGTLHQADHTRVISRVRAALGDELLAAGWAVGQRLSLDQVIDEALRGQA